MTINEVSRRSSPREQHTKNDWSKIGLTVCYVTQVKQQSHITFGPKHPLHVCSRLHSQEITRKQCPKSVKKHLRKTFPFFQVNISPCCMQLNITIVCKNDHFVGDILLLNAHHGHQNHLPTAQRNLESRLGTWLSKKKNGAFSESMVVISPIFKKKQCHTSFDLQMFCGISKAFFFKASSLETQTISTQLAKKLIVFCPCQNLATALCLSQKLLDELVSEPVAGKKRKAWKSGTCFFSNMNV